MGRVPAAGGSVAHRDGCAPRRRGRPRTRTRRHHESALRGEVQVTEPAWVEHAIWWQVYPLGFVGAYPSDPPPTADEHRLRRIVDWLGHAGELRASGVALRPLFTSHT